MIAERLKLARAKAGLSLRGLSDAMGNRVTAQAIGKYERNEDIPSSGVMITLAKSLGVSIAYLMDTEGIALSDVDFRADTAARVRDRAHVKTAVLETIERYLQIEAILELDSAEWHSPIKVPRKISAPEDAEALADEVREVWSLGRDPIPNMTELLEEKGLKVLILDLPERVSGFTCKVQRPGGMPELPVVVVNGKQTLERRRLTLGHELAHQLIDAAHLAPKAAERAANVFAGAFLMPRAHLLDEVGKRHHVPGYDELISLKHLYRVSGAALLVRLAQVEAISQKVLVYAFQSVARNWRTNEPVPIERNPGEEEQTERFKRLCYRAFSEGLMSQAKAAELLRLPVHDVETGLKGPQNGVAPHHLG